MTDAQYSVVSPISALYVPMRSMCSTVYCSRRHASHETVRGLSGDSAAPCQHALLDRLLCKCAEQLASRRAFGAKTGSLSLCSASTSSRVCPIQANYRSK